MSYLSLYSPKPYDVLDTVVAQYMFCYLVLMVHMVFPSYTVLVMDSYL